jgi:hypothetical protein
MDDHLAQRAHAAVTSAAGFVASRFVVAAEVVAGVLLATLQPWIIAGILATLAATSLVITANKKNAIVARRGGYSLT